MGTNLFQEIKQYLFHPKDALSGLIVINVVVFLFINLVKSILFLSDSMAYFQDLLRFLAFPASISSFLHKPWTIFTYMFLHEGFFHLLFNLLYLYWLGRIFKDFLHHKKLITVYLLGGLAGAFLYMLFYNVFPVFANSLPQATVLGASAGVLAVVIATATLVPDYSISIIFIGPVRLKYIAAFLVVLDIISISSSNSGGHIAHLGGALLGFVYVRQLRSGNDFGQFFVRIASGFSGFFKKKPSMQKMGGIPSKSRPKASGPDQKTIDKILDKISHSGYDSLTKEEKQILFKASEEK